MMLLAVGACGDDDEAETDAQIIGQKVTKIGLRVCETKTECSRRAFKLWLKVNAVVCGRSWTTLMH
ncbi:MAG: hypothetical protein AAFV32_06010 [Myxococcota bacterium]